jgi:general stress protein YciG
MESVDCAVFGKLASDVLRPELVRTVIDGVIEAMSRASMIAERERRGGELVSLDQGIERLTEAIAHGGQASVAPDGPANEPGTRGGAPSPDAGDDDERASG